MKHWEPAERRSLTVAAALAGAVFDLALVLAGVVTAIVASVPAGLAVIALGLVSLAILAVLVRSGGREP
jgi:hypothetical protein